MEFYNLTRKLKRWALMSMEYDFKVVHRASLVNMDANRLSRNSIASQADATGARWHVTNEENSLPRLHCFTFLGLLVMQGETTGNPDGATTNDTVVEGCEGVRNIFEDGNVMRYCRNTKTQENPI